jgi:tRNA threonylcarbamoyladenosine biosynthesis protein TsaB
LTVLGIETATRIGSVGIVSIDGEGCDPARADVRRLEVLAEVSCDTGLQHGEVLLPLVDRCLSAGGVGLDGVDVVAVSLGPGSFTGLRVGLATAKGLVLGTRAALVGVPTLAALAAGLVGGRWAPEGFSRGAAEPRRLVCTCLDARRGEVYGALFSVDTHAGSPADVGVAERLLEDVAGTPEALADAVSGRVAAIRSELDDAGLAPEPLWLVGDGAERYAERLVRGLGGATCVVPFAAFHGRGAVVAALGAAEMARRGVDEPGSLAPRYARVSDAERALARHRSPEPSA